MMKKLFVIFVFLSFIFASCKKSEKYREIEYTYNNKTKTFSITYPEYHHVKPYAVELPIKNINIYPYIDFRYKLTIDNEPIIINVKVLFEDGSESEYNITHPVVNKTSSINILPNDFNPPAKNNDIIKKVYINVISDGQYDTKYYLELMVVDKKTSDLLKGKEAKNKKRNTEYATLVTPMPGHYAKSNPPFLYWDKKIPNTTVYISKNKNFDIEDTKIYNVSADNFLTLPERLTYGKWFVKIANGNDTNVEAYSFIVGDESLDIDIITPYAPTNTRPFIIMDKNRLDEIKNYYTYMLNYPAPRTMLGRNMSSFISYIDKEKGKWNKNRIIYETESRTPNSIKFSDLPHHIMLMSLFASVEKNPTNTIQEIKKIINDVINIDTSKIQKYSSIEADAILAMPIAVALDWLYPYLSTEEIINIKIDLIKKGDNIYKYLRENMNKYYEIKNINYVSLLGIIGAVLYNENTEDEKVKEWYRFAFAYINSLVLTQIGEDGDTAHTLDNTYSMMFNLMLYYKSLYNASSINMFNNIRIKNTPEYLTYVGYRGSHILPYGDNIKIEYGLLRNTNFIETFVMDAMAGIYYNPIYKMHAAYGVNEAISYNYMPYVLILNGDNAGNAALSQARLAPYKYAFFNKTSTVIYNESPFTNKGAYFSAYGKGKSYSPYIKSHNDRMSFVYYNYGDMFINEGGFFGETEGERYRFISSAKAHSGISIGQNDILEHPLSFSYIENAENSQNDLYVKMSATDKYTYSEYIKTYERRFYYIKPDILIIKDNIEAYADIYGEKFRDKYPYTWRFTTRLDTEINSSGNSFTIYGKYSKANVYFIDENSVSLSITNYENGVNEKLNICEIATKEEIKSFSPWVIIATEKYDKSYTPITIIEANTNTLVFEYSGKLYTINTQSEKYRLIQTANSINIVSD